MTPTHLRAEVLGLLLPLTKGVLKAALVACRLGTALLRAPPGRGAAGRSPRNEGPAVEAECAQIAGISRAHREEICTIYFEGNMQRPQMGSAASAGAGQLT